VGTGGPLCCGGGGGGILPLGQAPTELSGVPGMPNTSTLSLGGLLSQTPGAECDFGGCLPLGNSVIGVDDAAEIGLCVVNPIACGIIFTGAVIAYEIWRYEQTHSNPGPELDEACELFASKFDGKQTECFYNCTELGEMCMTTSGSCPRFQWSHALSPCD
jgi:hypothetical protein